MTTATTETTRLTSDPVPPDELRADVARLFEAMAAGGIGIVPLVDTDYPAMRFGPSNWDRGAPDLQIAISRPISTTESRGSLK